jgi:hypothetical protein
MHPNKRVRAPLAVTPNTSSGNSAMSDHPVGATRPTGDGRGPEVRRTPEHLPAGSRGGGMYRDEEHK